MVVHNSNHKYQPMSAATMKSENNLGALSMEQMFLDKRV